MKLLIGILFLILVVQACTSDAERTPAKETHKAHTAPVLRLDNDRKWPADEPTTAGIENMQQLMDSFTDGKNYDSPEAYQVLGKTMDGELKSIFKTCTMTGPAHDELHKFLIPIVEDVKVLQENDLEAASAAQLRLEERLFMYQTFFQ